MPVRIEQLAAAVEPLEPDLTVADVMRRFSDAPDLAALPVVLDGAPVGLLRRARLFEFAQQSEDTLQTTAIAKLMDPNPFIGEAGVPASFVAQLELEDTLPALVGGVIVAQDQHYVGYAPALAIAQAVASENAERARVMKRHRSAKPAAMIARPAPSADWIANIAYQIRTPLNAALGMADLLGAQGLRGEAKDWANALAGAVQQLDTLLGDILSAAEIPAISGELQGVQPFDLKTFTQSLTEIWRPRIQVHAQSLKLGIQKGTPPRIRADERRLKQVLCILVGAALEQSGHGGTVNVRFAVESEDQASRLVATVLAVPAAKPDSVTGPGVAASWVHESGLGQAITERVVGEISGSISWGDASNGEHVVTLTCPVEPAVPRLAVANPKIDRNRRAFELGEVLVAEDHEVSAIIMRAALDGAGWSVTVATDGEMALELASERRFQAVLLDRYMPGLSGPEVAQALRSGDGPNAGAPIISLSADPFIEETDKSIMKHFTMLIEKPVRPRDLVAALSDAILSAPPRELNRRINAV